mgnify:CR=1 FL=1
MYKRQAIYSQPILAPWNISVTLVGDRYEEPASKLATASFVEPNRLLFSEATIQGERYFLTGVAGGYEYLLYETAYEGSDSSIITSNTDSFTVHQFKFIAKNLDILGEGLIDSFALKWSMGPYFSFSSTGSLSYLAKLGIQRVPTWTSPQENKDEVSTAAVEKFMALPEYEKAHTIMWYIDCRSETRTKPQLLAEVEKGEKKIINAEGLLAVCIQHEIDHLNGKLFIDYLGTIKKQLITRKMQKFKREMERKET